ncbi:hypothetical protein GCM10022261_24300 [Brevibacterium daeguense]|uniref:DUF3515 family protein n=1 Tax=Brevibacterium daeguense TaxID=909936 RepID=A0ABP8ELQ0_9MICO|nr:DUF3515 domain-containing protein [Brevibacterium daeguense]
MTPGLLHPTRDHPSEKERTTLVGMTRSPRALGPLALLLPVLAGCTPALVVEPAPNAADPACAEIMLRMPHEVDGQPDRDTSSQGTEAWGDPAIAIARCGMEPPAPTTDRCVSVDGVDWISTGQTDESWTFVSYGREPAVEVLVDPTAVPGATVLAEVSPAVAQIEPYASCVGPDEVTEEGVPEVPED